MRLKQLTDITGGIITSMLADDAVTDAKIVDGTISAAKLAGGIGGSLISAGAISSAHLAADAVEAAAIADGAVGTAALAADAVNGSKLADDAVNSEHIADGAIDTVHIADANVTTAKLADDAVTDAKILDSTISAAKLAGGIGLSLLSDGAKVMLDDAAVLQADLDANGFTVSGLAAPSNATDAATKGYVDSALAGLDFQPDVLDVQEDATLNVTGHSDGDRYLITASGALHASFGTITGVGDGDIVESNGTTFDIAYDVSAQGEGALVWDRDSNQWMRWDGTSWDQFGGLSGVTAGTGLTKVGDTISIADGGVDTTQLAADAVDGTKIADDAIDSEHIAAGAIDPEHLAASAVETAKIADDAVTAAKLAAGIVSIGMGVGDSGDIGKAPAGTYNGASVETNVDIAAAPLGRVWVKVNDAIYEAGVTGTTADPFWFDATGDGSTPSAWNSIVAGDKLYVDTNVLGFTLDTSDEISLIYTPKNS